MLRPLRQFLRLDRARQRLFLEAWRQLAVARYALGRTPFRELVAGLELHRAPPELTPVGEEARDTARCIGWAVAAAARYTPWRSTCLVQVLAAQRMLAGRLLPGAIYIGAAPGEGAAVSLDAHAWLRCGEDFVTGEHGHQRYAVVSTWSWQ